MELHYVLIQWNTISSWYFGSSQPLYFDTLCQGSKLHIFQIILNPDLSTASLHAISTSELTTQDFNYVTFQDYTICEDSLVSCWFKFDSGQNQYQLKYGVYTGLMSSRFANVLTHGGTMLLSGIGRDYDLHYCPASRAGRFVRQQ